MVEPTDLWKLDARRLRELDAGEGWVFAACVACSVQPDRGRGKRNECSESGKVSATAFARVAGTSVPRVMRFYDAWQRAAADGLVVPSKDLQPGSAASLAVPTDTPWSIYSKPPVKGSAEDEQRASQVLRRLQSDPEKIYAALPEEVRAEVAAQIIHSGTDAADEVYSLAGAALAEARSRLKHPEDEQTGGAHSFGGNDPANEVQASERTLARLSKIAVKALLWEDIPDDMIDRMYQVVHGMRAGADQIEEALEEILQTREGLHDEEDEEANAPSQEGTAATVGKAA